MESSRGSFNHDIFLTPLKKAQLIHSSFNVQIYTYLINACIHIYVILGTPNLCLAKNII